MIETNNIFGVCIAGERIGIARNPVEITKEQAINLAAWLVALAQPPYDKKDFDELYNKINRE